MTVVHVRRSPYTHYIGRRVRRYNLHDSPLRNIFHIGVHGNRAEVIAKFEADARERLMDIIRELPEDAILACWCSPEPCHGDVIIKLWKEIHQVPVAA